MAKINEALVLLNNLIHSNVDDMIKMSKNALCKIHSCLQDAHEKIEFLQLESQLQQEELQQKSHHSEPVSVQKIVKDSHQQQVSKVPVDSHSVPCTRADVHADAAVQPALLKPIIRPWEELVHNKHKNSLGYDKDVTFHIPDYTKPIIFQSAGFLYDSSPAAISDHVLLPQQQIVKCQHYDRVGHTKDHFFDLHPCKHCGRHTHSSHRCFKNKPPARTKIHLGWIASWQWASATKKMFKSHVRTCSRILRKLAVEFSPSYHLLPDRGEMVVIYKLESHIKRA